MSPKKHKLSVSIDENYCLLGIVSDEPDYKLCWMINQQMNTAFVKTEDLILFNKRLNEEESVSLFLYDDEKKMVTYRIIGNRTPSGYFLPDLKNIDYVLHMQGEIIPDDINKVIRNINRLEKVRMCVPVDLQKIRDREKLHLW
ncbi:MAG: IPExxxVDY family protein [Bacteroidales bacterium]